eukprot:ANDGO_07427.mRNA.1 hypothetical protein CAOG_08509
MRKFNERLVKRGRAPLVLRCPSTIERSREYSFNKPSVDEFFVLLKEAFERAGIRSPADAWRVVNMDETGVQGDQESKNRVLAPRGTRRVQLKVNPERNHVTMINAISADGKAYTPMFVYAGTGPTQDFVRHVLCGKGYSNTMLARTENGWTDSDVFLEFLEFLKEQLPALGDDEKVVLIVDGHSTHTTIPALRWCLENRWELVTFPAHCTHEMQPLDVGCYKRVKQMFRSEKQALEHEKIAGGKVILLPDDQSIILKKSDDANTYCLLEAWKSVSTKAVQDAFRMTGIFPLNVKMFDNKFVDREDVLQRATEFKIIIHSVTPALMREPQNQGNGVLGADAEDEEGAPAHSATSAPSERVLQHGSRGALSKKTLSEASKRNPKGCAQALCADVTLQLLDQQEEEKRQQEKAKSERAAKRMKTSVAMDVRNQ